MRLNQSCLALMATLCSLCISPCNAQTSDVAGLSPIQVKDPFNGTWYVIAHVPHYLEHGQVATKFTYTKIDSDAIEVCYLHRAWFTEPEKELCTRAHISYTEDSPKLNGHWHHVIPFYQQFVVSDPKGQWIVLDNSKHNILWILARNPDMDSQLYWQLIEKLRTSYGLFTDKLQRVCQLPTQVNQLGFEVLQTQTSSINK